MCGTRARGAEAGVEALGMRRVVARGCEAPGLAVEALGMRWVVARGREAPGLAVEALGMRWVVARRREAPGLAVEALGMWWVVARGCEAPGLAEPRPGGGAFGAGHKHVPVGLRARHPCLARRRRPLPPTTPPPAARGGTEHRRRNGAGHRPLRLRGGRGRPLAEIKRTGGTAGPGGSHSAKGLPRPPRSLARRNHIAQQATAFGHARRQVTALK